MTTTLRITRKIKAYTVGINGIGTKDWELHLECGHVKAKTEEELRNLGFQTDLECIECIEKFTKEIEMYSTEVAQTTIRGR